MKKAFLFLAVLPLFALVSCEKNSGTENSENNNGETAEPDPFIPAVISYENPTAGATYTQEYAFEYDNQNRITRWQETLVSPNNVFTLHRRVYYEGNSNKVLSIEESAGTSAVSTVTYAYSGNVITASNKDTIYLNDRGLISEWRNSGAVKYEYDGNDNISTLTVWENGQKTIEQNYAYNTETRGVFYRVNAPQWLIVSRLLNNSEYMNFAQSINSVCTETVYKTFGETGSVKNLTFDFFLSYPREIALKEDPVFKFKLFYESPAEQ